MKYYDITFTTDKLVRKFDARGKEIGSYALPTPIKLSGLREDVADKYAGCTDFQKVEANGPNNLGGEAFPKVDYGAIRAKNRRESAVDLIDLDEARERARERASSRAAERRREHEDQDRRTRAARTGDLAEALNG